MSFDSREKDSRTASEHQNESRYLKQLMERNRQKNAPAASREMEASTANSDSHPATGTTDVQPAA